MSSMAASNIPRMLKASTARFLSTAAAASPSAAPLSHRSVLEVSGPDAQKFLKGLSCKDVEPLGGGYSGFLNASGRILHTVFIFLKPDARQPTYLISHDSPIDHPAPLQTLLPPFRLRSKVRIRDVTPEWEVWSAWGDATVAEGSRPSRQWRFGSGGAAESQWSWDGTMRDLQLGGGELGCWDLRAGWGQMGRQVLLPRGQRPSLLSNYDTIETENYHLHRMTMGVPEGHAEIVPGTALPLESCMDIHGGVDFRKGCYLGQELTVRTYHTGATRKRILPIRLIPLDQPDQLLFQSIPPAPPTSLQRVSGSFEVTYHPPTSSTTQKTRSAGKILCTHPVEGSVGLALIRLEMAERSWWSGDIVSGTVKEWLSSGVGRLTADIEGRHWGVYVDKGAAYQEALLRQMS